MCAKYNRNMPENPPITLTKHARLRCFQRGIDAARVLAVVALRMAQADWPKVKMTLIDKDITIIYNHASGRIYTVHHSDIDRESIMIDAVLGARKRKQMRRNKGKS